VERATCTCVCVCRCSVWFKREYGLSAVHSWAHGIEKERTGTRPIDVLPGPGILVHSTIAFLVPAYTSHATGSPQGWR